MSESFRGFLWFLLAFSSAVALVPQLLTRTAAGNRLFDPYGTRNDEPGWVDRGMRLAFAGLATIAAATLYLTISS